MFTALARYRKFITALFGAVVVFAAGFAPGKYDSELAAIAAILAALGVYSVPNATVPNA